MDAAPNQVFFPESFQELFGYWSRFPDAVPYAGGTDLLRGQVKRVPVLPRNILCLEKMQDLKRITRTERYLEIGAMVGLNEIINLGKIVPPILIKTLGGIEGPALRNIATIGGNYLYTFIKIIFFRFAKKHSKHIKYLGEVDIIIGADLFMKNDANACFDEYFFLYHEEADLQYQLARKNKKSILIDGPEIIHYSGKSDTFESRKDVTKRYFSPSRMQDLQDRNSETRLIGKQLPLDRKEAFSYLESWKHYLSGMQDAAASIKNGFSKPQVDLIKVQITNFIEDAILEIAD